MAGTRISINEDAGELTGLLLNIAEVEKNTEYTKIAYCAKVDVGMTSDADPKRFFKFTLLDKGGHGIIGRLFNVESIELKGVTANNLKSKVVKIRFMLSTFGGTNSLTLYSIDPIPDNMLSREEFIGEIPGIDDDVNYINKISREVCSMYDGIGSLISKYHLLSGINTVTMPDLWAERKGGAVKFSSMFARACEATFSSDTEEVRNSVKAILLLSELFMYWKYAANYEENIMSLGSNINDILAKSDKYLDAVVVYAQRNNSIAELNICKETKHLLKCYFGYDEPKTYISASLCGIRKSILNKLRLQEEHESMLPGTYKTISDGNGGFMQIVHLNVR